MSNAQSFQAGIDFESILRIISKQVYETPPSPSFAKMYRTPLMQSAYKPIGDELPTDDPVYLIDVSVSDRRIVVRDNGIGMSAADLKDYFWTIGCEWQADGRSTCGRLCGYVRNRWVCQFWSV